MAKLKKAELTPLQDAVNKLNNLQIQIGGLEGQKHELLHMMTKAKEDLSVIQKNLEDVYGQVSVDIKTGEIKEDDTKD
jgi:hypothetical protein|tara:strand:- start:28 stop:261 length:234 start_codon:yes stop_codon:yes gene_type:complete